ncbi:MAG: hypothetical protein WCC18_19125 [Candidatus Acidiferrales bacterium]
MNNPQRAVDGIITALVLVIFIAGVEHVVPYNVPAVAAPVVVMSAPATVQQIAPAAPANCLPSGNGGECLSFDTIQKLMDAQPDTLEVIPPNPAAKNLERI